MKKLALVTLVSLAVSVPAVASDMYVGVKLGSTKHEISQSGYTETVSAGGFFAGYIVNPNVAVEVEATNLGSIATELVDVSALSMSVVGSHNINDQASLFGKLGIAATREEAVGIIAKKTGVTFGFGGQYNVNQTVGLRLGWDHYKYGGENGWYEATANMTSISALFKF